MTRCSVQVLTSTLVSINRPSLRDFADLHVIERTFFLLPGSLPASGPISLLTGMRFSSILYILGYLLAQLTLSPLASEWASSPRRFATARSFAYLHCPISNLAIDVSPHSTRLLSLPEPNLHPTDRIHFFFFICAPSLEKRETESAYAHARRFLRSAGATESLPRIILVR